MEVKEYRKTQQNMLEQFFENYFEKSKINGGYKWTGIIFIAILVILMWFPYQSYENEKPIRNIGLVWGVMGTFFYMNMYRFAFNGRGAVTNVYQYLEYLPVSIKELKIFRLKKLISLLVKVYLIAQAGQAIFSLLGYHELILGNLLFPLVFAFLAPLLIVGISILVSK